MRGARRRFHGYCPTNARRTTNQIIYAPDDYTSTMSGMTVQIVRSGDANHLQDIQFTESPIVEISSFDDNEDGSTCSVMEENKLEREQRFVQIRRRQDEFPEQNRLNAIVTSLSNDSRDSSIYPTKGKNASFVKLSDPLFPTPNEIDESRDLSLSSDSFAAEQNECDTPEATLAVSTLTDNTAEHPVEAIGANISSDRSFLAFRINYLIVTIAIMLADGLQGKLKSLWLQGIKVLKMISRSQRNTSLRSIRGLWIFCSVFI